MIDTTIQLTDEPRWVYVTATRWGATGFEDSETRLVRIAADQMTFARLEAIAALRSRREVTS